MSFRFPAAALILAILVTPALAALSGTVRDATDAPVANAEVEILHAGGTPIVLLRSDAQGRFNWAESKSGFLQFRVSSEGFAAKEIFVFLDAQDKQLSITLEPRSVYTRITVNATRGAADEAISSQHIAIVKDRTDMLKRPVATLGNVLEQEPGVLVQQSTTAQVSPFLRGLTGYQVLNLIDGIRFNNSTFRSGPNQYLAYVEPAQAQRVEVLLGPTGVQYGSDSLGGTINVETPQPRFASGDSWETHGDFVVGGATCGSFRQRKWACFRIERQVLRVARRFRTPPQRCARRRWAGLA